jgi:hypothetical protein
MNNDPHTQPVTIAVACTNASGSPDFFIARFEMDQQDMDYGLHYDAAIDQAKQDNYEGPFICFDETEFSAIHRSSQMLSGH